MAAGKQFVIEKKIAMPVPEQVRDDGRASPFSKKIERRFPLGGGNDK
jgi:hypothetical protein